MGPEFLFWRPTFSGYTSLELLSDSAETQERVLLALRRHCGNEIMCRVMLLELTSPPLHLRVATERTQKTGLGRCMGFCVHFIYIYFH